MGLDFSRLPDSQLMGVVANASKEDSEKAFREIYRRFADSIFNYIRSMGVRQEDTKDVLQEIFMRLYKSASKFDARKSLAPYLFMIARNTVFSFLRKNPRRKEVSLENSPVAFSWKVYSHKDDIIALRKAFSRLPDELKDILFLRYYMNFSQKEIAEAMGLTPRQVSLRLQKAEKMLKVFIEE